MNVLIDMKPTLYRWFNPDVIVRDPYIRTAVADLLEAITAMAIGNDPDVDVIGSSGYLVNCGFNHDVLNQFMARCGNEIRLFYMNNTLPEWRDYNRHRITISNEFMVFIELGVDPYV